MIAELIERNQEILSQYDEMLIRGVRPMFAKRVLMSKYNLRSIRSIDNAMKAAQNLRNIL